jgi:hypothetical protein
MRRRRIGYWGGALLLAASAGCGDEPPELPATTSEWTTPTSGEAEAAGQNRPPVIEALRLDPAEPVSGDSVRAVLSVNEPDGDPVKLGFTWSIDDRVLAESGAQIALEDVGRGTRIAVVVTASDGSAESEPARASVTVPNRRPVMTGLELDPGGDVPRGRPVVAKPSARDPDGDALEFHYDWTVKGRAVAASGPRLETGELRKGDAIQVEVWASDDDDESDRIYSHVLKIANGVPEIVSVPTGFDADGTLRYAIEARDPDGDRNLRYSLEQGPKGMTVDPISGQLVWRPGADDEGVHPVKLVVQDSEGARVDQTFDITVSVGEAEAGSVPAAME